MAFIWDPDQRRLHWMKRRRCAGGMPAKPNLLVQYEPLRRGHAYQFFLFEVPAGECAPGPQHGLLERDACSVHSRGSSGSRTSRRSRGPRNVQREPWSVEQYAQNFPEGTAIVESLEFYCGSPEDFDAVDADDPTEAVAALADADASATHSTDDDDGDDDDEDDDTDPANAAVDDDEDDEDTDDDHRYTMQFMAMVGPV